MNIVELKKGEYRGLEEFLQNLGTATESFRYFQTRPISVIKGHLVTVLLYDDGRPVGYGHLDPENDQVWLGIAIQPGYQGKGLGKIIMNALIDKAEQLNVRDIKLTVDDNNHSAIHLYKSYGFTQQVKFERSAEYLLGLKGN